MSTPLDVEPSAADARPGAATTVAGRRIEGRSLGQIAWMRFKRDRIALTAGVVIAVLAALAIFADPIVAIFGHPPNDYHLNLIDPTFQIPKGRFGGIGPHYLLGVEPGTGRDLFSRMVYGARISLLVATLATLVSVLLGTVLGITAGYFGGWIDTVISRTMDVLLAFPILLFAIGLGAIVNSSNSLFGLTGATQSVVMLVVIIGFFNWPYIGRIIRGQTFSLREKEFVEAARSLGAGSGHILFRQLLPNLIAPILVYSTLIIPTNILFEAALSFLGVGVKPPTPSWGAMLSTAVQTYTIDPTFMIVPGAAIFITVLAFNLLGDGLRDALDPRAGR